MTTLNDTILQKASGESRLNPDEQRFFMGTFKERVVAHADFSILDKPAFLQVFPDICQNLLSSYSPLFLKLSPKLADSFQIQLMKTAQDLGIITSIIDEQLAHSPFAFLFHTDHALDLEETDIQQLFSTMLTPKENKETKLPFWKRFF